jgi:hypothetical protein
VVVTIIRSKVLCSSLMMIADKVLIGLRVILYVHTLAPGKLGQRYASGRRKQLIDGPGGPRAHKAV